MELKKFYEHKAIGFVIVLAFILVGVFLFKKSDTTVINQLPPKQTPEKSVTSSTAISTQNIMEENFTGTRPVIVGDTLISLRARDYIKERVADFKTQADKDVPDMREKFGADSPMANYTIDIGAKYVKGDKTESIIIDMYAYTGGANGNSSFKVITASRGNGKILSLSDIIKKGQENAFTEFLKKELSAWKPTGADGPVVFPEEVNNLKFDSFQNWSLDDKNLTIYFDKYEIGPGVLGAVAFPLSFDKINNFLLN